VPFLFQLPTKNKSLHRASTEVSLTWNAVVQLLPGLLSAVSRLAVQDPLKYKRKT